MNLSRKIRNLRHLALTLLVCGLAPAAWGAHRVFLAWDPNPESDIGGYKIYYGVESRVYDVVVDVGNVTNTIITNLTSGTTYYFAATAYNLASLESDFSEEVSLTTSTPGPAAGVVTTNLVLWLKGDAGVTAAGANVAEWQDQSGHARHAAQPTVGNQPMLVSNGRNGMPVLRFDGVDDFLTFNLPVNGLSEMSLVLVCANSQSRDGGVANVQYAPLFWNESAGWGTVHLSPFQSSVKFRFGTTQANNLPQYTRPASVGSDFTITVAVKSGASEYLYVNGSMVLSQGGKLSSIAGCQDIGNLGRGYNNTFFPGDIAEVLVYARALTDAERSAVEQHLSSKYALTATQPPTLSLPAQFVAQKQIATSLPGLQVSDPDGSQEMIQLDLAANRGSLTLSGSVSGGVTTAQIIGNRSKNLQITASVAALNTTLAAANGLVYTGDLNLVGLDTLSATVKNSGSAGPGTTRTASVQVDGDTLDTWRNRFFSPSDLVDPTKETTIFGDKADPDQDGLDNLLEHGLGLNPVAKGTLEEVVVMEIREGANEEKHASLTFPRRKNQSLVQYQPEVSSDKVTWYSGPGVLAEIGRQDRDNEFEVVTFQDLTSIEPTRTRFIRLKIVRTIQE
jgi:hypothetical protein